MFLGLSMCVFFFFGGGRWQCKYKIGLRILTNSEEYIQMENNLVETRLDKFFEIY